jgi:hypothetical protein
MKTAFVIAVAGLLVSLAGPGVVAEDTPPKIKGEVVQLMQQTGTRNEGELDALMIRTRQGEEMKLLLGAAGTSQGHVQEGDRVSVDLAAGAPTEDGYRVRAMKVRRTGQSFEYRSAEGEMVRTQTRTRARNTDGTGDGSRTQTRSRARVHEPGTGNCQSGGGGSRGGGAGRGGGGGRR